MLNNFSRLVLTALVEKDLTPEALALLCGITPHETLCKLSMDGLIIEDLHTGSPPTGHLYALSKLGVLRLELDRENSAGAMC